MGAIFFLIRLPFFLIGFLFCIPFYIIGLPLIIAGHFLWTIWIAATRLLGLPFRLIGAAWKNDSKILTLGLKEKLADVSRSWDSSFSNYFSFSALRGLCQWQVHGSR